MAINFDRLFTTQGLYAGALNEVNTWRGTINTRAGTLNTQLVTTVVYADLYTTTFTIRDTARTAEDSYVAGLASQAETGLIAEVVADRPLGSEDIDTALEELVRQMVIGGESLNACPGSVAVADVGSPTGDHEFVFGVYEGNGKKTDFLVPDVYLITCTADRSQGGTAYAETFSVVGKPADALPTDAAYPSGTGIDTNVTAVDPASDGGLLTDTDFDTFTVANIPDNWSLRTGTVAGTHIFEKASDDPRGTTTANKSVRLLGDGVVVPRFYQEVDAEPGTTYAVTLRIKKVTDPGSDWKVSIRLVDSTGAAVAGPASYANLITSATAASVASNWTNVLTGVFVTPDVLPVLGLFFEIVFHDTAGVTTAPVNTAEVYVDYPAMVLTEQMYEGGPTLTCFSGITEAIVGDTRTGTATLDSGVPSTYLIRQMDRLLGLAERADRIPTVSDASETQLDSLVT